MQFSLLLSVLLVVFGFSRAEGASRYAFHTEQDLKGIHPQHDSLRIRISPSSENLLNPERLHVKLVAPATKLFSTTDFPIVEGSTLFDSEISQENGKFEFSFVPPIRGLYQIEVSSASDPSPETWSFSIPENPGKVKNLVIFLAILGLICLGSGYVLGFTEPKAKSFAELAVLALLVGVGLSSGKVQAHGDEHQAPKNEGPVEASRESPQGLHLDLRVLTTNPRVGEPAELAASLRDANGQAVPARFRLVFSQLEHGIDVFSTELLENDGDLNWKGQFYDGSTHRVTVEATPVDPLLKPVRNEVDVEVEAISPPALAVGKSFSSMMIFSALMMGFGFSLGRYRKRKALA